MLRGIERRVLPVPLQRRGTDGVGVGCVRHVHRAADRRFAAAIGPILRPPETASVEYALLRLAILTEPALDDLDAVEIGAVGVAHGSHQEGRRFASGSGLEVSIRWHAMGVTIRREVGTIAVRQNEVKACEHANDGRSAVVA